jgi:hypothetical protein
MFSQIDTLYLCVYTDRMPANRSMPASNVIPTLAYPNVPAAADWLCAAFGFSVRLRIGSHALWLLLDVSSERQ